MARSTRLALKPKPTLHGRDKWDVAESEYQPTDAKVHVYMYTVSVNTHTLVSAANATCVDAGRVLTLVGM